MIFIFIVGDTVVRRSDTGFSSQHNLVGLWVASFEIHGGQSGTVQIFLVVSFDCLCKSSFHHYFTRNYEHALKYVAAWAKQCTITFYVF